MISALYRKMTGCDTAHLSPSSGPVESLAKHFFGIPTTHLVKAEMLDITGNDAEEILKQEIEKWA
jgi:FMN-dependent NADH-azoreductase